VWQLPLIEPVKVDNRFTDPDREPYLNHSPRLRCLNSSRLLLDLMGT
jgi:hypothetical protein